MIGHFVLALVAFHSAATPSPYETISVSPISLAEGLKAFEEICLASFPDEAAFQSSVRASPLRFSRILDRSGLPRSKWRSQFASVIYVRQNGQWPMRELPQCNMDFQIEPTGALDEVVQAVDRILQTHSNEVAPRKLLKFGVRWKWRERGRPVQLFLIRNDQTKPGQVTLSLQPR